MSKIVLDSVVSGYNLSKINANFQKIEDELNDKVLYRDSPVGESNELNNDIDANGFSIFNVEKLNGIDISSLNENYDIVSDNIDNINIVGENIANVNIVGTNIDKINTVVTNLTDIHNFADVYQGAKATNPTLRNDGSALQLGDLYFNTTISQFKVYDSVAWVANPVNSIAISPEDYGAVGNGNFSTGAGTDDSAAFELCLNAAIASGKPIQLNSVYKIADADKLVLDNHDNLIIYGTGFDTGLIVEVDATQTSVWIKSAVHLSDFRIHCKPTEAKPADSGHLQACVTVGDGFYLNRDHIEVQDWRVERMRLTRASGVGGGLAFIGIGNVSHGYIGEIDDIGSGESHSGLVAFHWGPRTATGTVGEVPTKTWHPRHISVGALYAENSAVALSTSACYDIVQNGQVTLIGGSQLYVSLPGDEIDTYSQHTAGAVGTGIQINGPLFGKNFSYESALTSVTVTAGGTGYTNGEPVNINASEGYGTGATGTVTVVAGAVTAVALTSPGTGFSSDDVLTITPLSGVGTGATGNPVVSGGVPIIDLSSVGTSKISTMPDDPGILVQKAIYSDVTIGDLTVVDSTDPMKYIVGTYKYYGALKLGKIIARGSNRAARGLSLSNSIGQTHVDFIDCETQSSALYLSSTSGVTVKGSNISTTKQVSTGRTAYLFGSTFTATASGAHAQYATKLTLAAGLSDFVLPGRPVKVNGEVVYATAYAPTGATAIYVTAIPTALVGGETITIDNQCYNLDLCLNIEKGYLGIDCAGSFGVLRGSVNNAFLTGARFRNGAIMELVGMAFSGNGRGRQATPSLATSDIQVTNTAARVKMIGGSCGIDGRLTEYNIRCSTSEGTWRRFIGVGVSFAGNVTSHITASTVNNWFMVGCTDKTGSLIV